MGRARRKSLHQDRRSTDHPPFSDMVTRGNLDDRLDAVRERTDGQKSIADERWEAHTRLADERWQAHRNVHEVVAESLRDYKKDANEWRTTLSDLRGTFLPKNEFQSEHRALEAKLHGEIQALAGTVASLDTVVDSAKGEIKDTRNEVKSIRDEQAARRSVFSDSRSVVATVGIVIGLIGGALLIFDRIK